MARQAWQNLGTLMLAFALAFAVWVSAVVAQDPNKEQSYPRPVELEVRGQNPALVIVGDLPEQVRMELSAPSSLWDRLINESNLIHAYIDLSGLEAGEHTVPIEFQSDLRPVRVASLDPAEIVLRLEARATQSFMVAVEVQGEPLLGFDAEKPVLTPEEVSVSGPESLMAEVEGVKAVLDLTGVRETFIADVNLQAIDAQGNVISGLSIQPDTVSVTQAIVQAGGYREVAVSVQTVGLPATGFRVVSITVTPPIVTLFSTDSDLISGLPGFVSTQPLDLTNASEDIETRLSLDLPEGIVVSGEQQSVEVFVGIESIESSIPLSVLVEAIGLSEGRTATISPQSVNVILSGPITVLESLRPGDVRLFVDLTGLGLGTHLLEPQSEILQANVQVLSLTPASLEVVIRVDDSSN
ncbi:MAG: CdaR family protein [Chloroflexi bacterium]|nr:CdaR family protein [Chloroflexota bacterium]